MFVAAAAGGATAVHYWFERGTRFESLAGLEFIVFTKLALNSQSSVRFGFLWAGTKGVCHRAQLTRTDFKASPLSLPLGGGGGMWGQRHRTQSLLQARQVPYR